MDSSMDKEFLDMIDGLTCYETFALAENVTDDFIREHTDYQSAAEFFAPPFAPEGRTFREMDVYVRLRSEFKTWKEFLFAAWRGKEKGGAGNTDLFKMLLILGHKQQDDFTPSPYIIATESWFLVGDRREELDRFQAFVK